MAKRNEEILQSIEEPASGSGTNAAQVTELREIPLYDRDGYFVDNPINRYSLNSDMLKRDKLGANLFAFIQRASIRVVSRSIEPML